MVMTSLKGLGRKKELLGVWSKKVNSFKVSAIRTCLISETYLDGCSQIRTCYFPGIYFHPYILKFAGIIIQIRSNRIMFIIFQ